MNRTRTHPMPRTAILSLLIAALGLAPAACGQGTAPDAPPVTKPVAKTATPSTPSPDAASPDDIAFARRLSNAFKSVAHNVEPSVVHVTQRNRVFQRNIFGQTLGSSVRDTGLGSGFIVSKDGYVVTNNHVIVAGQRAAEEIKVRLHDGSEVPATLVGRDELTDLAVLKIDPKDLKDTPITITPVTFGDSDAMEVGEWVVAIGSPFGLDKTVTAGIISAKGRSITPRETGRVHEDFIQTDAAINPGNSGGPLLNLSGEVVGINSAIASQSGGYQGIGFAIPSNVAKAVMENIIANGRVIRGWLGVDLADAAREAGSRTNGGSGVLVRTVQEDSPAAAAGLQEGDIITRFQGRAVNEARLRNAIALTAPNTKVDIEVLRDGQPRTLTATLADQSAAMGHTDVPALGARVRTITRELAQAINQPRLRGVIVTEVDPDSRAATHDLRVGDVIVGYRQGNMSGTITSAEQFQKFTQALDYSVGVQLNVVREENGFIQRGYLVIQD